MIKEYIRNNCKVEIIQEDCVDNPRLEWDHVGTMVTGHRRYKLSEEEGGPDEWEAIDNDEDKLSLPIYMMDHSGLSVRSASFGCPWDSGRVGVVYVTKEDAKASFGEDFEEAAMNCLEAEIEELNQYLTGDVYWVRVTNPFGEEETLGCIYGSDEAEQEANQMADAYVHQELATQIVLGCTGTGTQKCR